MEVTLSLFFNESDQELTYMNIDPMLANQGTQQHVSDSSASRAAGLRIHTISTTAGCSDRHIVRLEDEVSLYSSLYINDSAACCM